jgi:uncharacterized surface protein with fasciclin (FAS1) repeats
VFAPTNEAFSNLPTNKLEVLATDASKLGSLVLDHLINKSIYSAGLRSHQRLNMASGTVMNVFSRKGGKLERII